jgi:hypothetical protein
MQITALLISTLSVPLSSPECEPDDRSPTGFCPKGGARSVAVGNEQVKKRHLDSNRNSF